MPYGRKRPTQNRDGVLPQLDARVNHVGWPHLVPLSLKLRAFRSVLAIGRPFEVIEGEPAARRTLDSLQKQLDGCVLPDERWYEPRKDEDPAEPPLQVRSQAIAAQFERNAAAREAGSLAERIHDALRTAGEARICDTCAEGQQAHRCRWTHLSAAMDAAAVRTRGDCLQPLTEIFLFCQHLAETQYAEHAVGPGVTAQLSLRTGFLSATGAAGLPLQGGTTSNPADQWQRTISIRFDAGRFGYGDYLALPYVIAHECIAHGHCGVAIDDETAEDSRAFHDGWMDLTAIRVLMRSTLDPQRFSFLRYRQEFERRARHVNEVRYSDGNGAVARQWKVGTRALAAFEQLVAYALQIHGGTEPTASVISRQVDELSLLINASALAHEQRALLVDSLNKRLSYSQPDDVKKGLEGCKEATYVLAGHLLDPLRSRKALSEQLVASIA